MRSAVRRERRVVQVWSKGGEKGRGQEREVVEGDATRRVVGGEEEGGDVGHTFEGCHVVHSQGRGEPQHYREGHLLLPLIDRLLHH